MTKAAKERFAVVLQSEATADTALRLRRVLKVLLRSFDFKCVSVSPISSSGKGSRTSKKQPQRKGKPV